MSHALQCISANHLSGRKTDVWYAIDLETGIKQQTLRLDGTETVCPLMSNKEAPIFFGRTGESIIVSLCSCRTIVA